MPESLSQSNKGFAKWFVPALILLVLLSFGGSLGTKYGLDDIYVIQENPHTTQGFSGIPKILTSRYTLLYGVVTDYRPVVLVSYAIEYQFFGESPGISHFFNLIFYLLVIWLSYLFLRRLFQEADLQLIQIIVIVFALHPLHSEVVLSLKNRDELFVAIFGLSALIQMMKYLDNRKWYHIVATVLFLFFSLISKKTGMAFVPILILSILYKSSSIKTTMISSVALLSMFFYKFLNGRVIEKGNVRPTFFHENPLYTESIGFIDRIPIALNTVARYMELFIWPDPLRYYYGYNTVDFPTWSNGYIYVVMLFVLAMFALAIYFWFKNKAIWAYGLLVWFSTIFIYSNLMKPAVGIMAERFVFVPILGLSIALGYWLYSLIKKFDGKYKNVGYALGTIALLLMVGKNMSRTADWKTEATLFEADMPHLKNSFKGHYMYAMSLYNQNKEEGIKDLRSWTIIKAHLDSALIIHSEPRAHNSRGSVLMEYFKDYKNAEKDFEQALEIDSTLAGVWLHLAQVKESFKEYENASNAYNKSIGYDSLNKITLKRACNLHAILGNGYEVVRIAGIGLRHYPEDYWFYTYSGNGYIIEEEFGKALEYMDHAYKLNPDPNVCKGILKIAESKGLQKYIDAYRNKCE